MNRKIISKPWKAVYNRIKPLWKKTFFPVGHFYSAIPDRQEAEIAMMRAVARADEPLAGISLSDENMLALWQDMAPFMREAPFSDTAKGGQRYQYLNGYFSYGDALVLYGLLKLLKPRKLIEVGSGYSSAVVLDTRDLTGFPEQVTCIEPYPQRLKSLLQPDDASTVSIVEQKVQQTDLRLYEELAADDFLFIDSSHVMKTGSDLNFIVHDVLPALKPGVVIHFHDIFWPFEYPEQWAVRENRGWNEIYAIRSFLMYNDAFEIMFFNDYFGRRHGKIAGKTCPLFMCMPGGGLWLKKRDAAAATS